MIVGENDFKAEAAFDSDPGSATPSWSDLSDRLRSASVKLASRSDPFSPIEAATLDATFADGDRALDPSYAGSPFFPNVRTRKRTRVWTPGNGYAAASSPVTLSGNELTDAVREVASEGDGRPYRAFIFRDAVGDLSAWESIQAVDLTQNWNQRPRFETETLGAAPSEYQARGTGTITPTVSALHAAFGSRSLQVVADGSAAGQGVIRSTTDPVTGIAQGVSVTVSAYVYLDPSHPTTNFRVAFNERNGATLGTGHDTGLAAVEPGVWTRISQTFTIADLVVTGVRMYVVRTGAGGSRTFWVDGLQVELSSDLHDYGDGSLGGNWYWQGAAWASATGRKGIVVVPDPYSESGYRRRHEVQAGDTFSSGNRAEAVLVGGMPGASGSERNQFAWGWETEFDRKSFTGPTGTQFGVFMQVHDTAGVGPPPLSFRYHDEKLELQVKTGNITVVGAPGSGGGADLFEYDATHTLLANPRKGVRHEFVCQARWSAEADGWLEVWHRERIAGESPGQFARVLALGNIPTMQAAQAGVADGVIYFKSGYYRNIDPGTWTDVVYQGNFRIAPSLEDLLLSVAPVNDSTVGIYRQRTNYVYNGGPTTDLTNWAKSDDGTHLTVLTYEAMPLGGNLTHGRVKVETQGFNTGEGVRAGSATGLALVGGGTYSGAIRARRVAGQPAPRVKVWVRAVYTDATVENENGASRFIYVLGDDERNYVAPAITTNGAKTIDKLQICMETTGSNQATQFYAAWARVVSGGAPGPYIHTTAGPATKSAGLIQIPSEGMSASSFWFAVRFRVGYDYRFGPGAASGSRIVFDWRKDDDNYVRCYWDEANLRFTLERRAAGVGGTATLSQTFPRDGYVTIICSGTAAGIALDADSPPDILRLPAPNASVLDANVPADMPATLNVGSGPSGGYKSLRVDVTLGLAALQAELDEQQALGAQVIRFSANWPNTETADGVFTWTKLDQAVAECEARGVQVVLQIQQSPTWAGTAGVWDPPRTVTSLNHLKGFCTALAARFGTRVALYEVWNEPNLTVFWTGGADPAEYAKVLRYAAEGLRAGNANVRIAGPCVNRSALGFLDKVYDNLEADVGVPTCRANGYYFDVLSMHPYCLTHAPGLAPGSDDIADSWGGVLGRCFLDYRRMRDLVFTREGVYKTLYFGEFGYYTDGSGGGNGPVTDATRATYIPLAYSLIRADGYVWALTWFGYDHGGAADIAGLTSETAFNNVPDAPAAGHLDGAIAWAAWGAGSAPAVGDLSRWFLNDPLPSGKIFGAAADVLGTWSADDASYRANADGYLFDGYAERWNETWLQGGFDAETALEAADGTNIIARLDLPTTDPAADNHDDVVLSDRPYLYLPLADHSGSRGSETESLGRNKTAGRYMKTPLVDQPGLAIGELDGSVRFRRSQSEYVLIPGVGKWSRGKDADYLGVEFLWKPVAVGSLQILASGEYDSGGSNKESWRVRMETSGAIGLQLRLELANDTFPITFQPESTTHYAANVLHHVFVEFYSGWYTAIWIDGVQEEFNDVYLPSVEQEIQNSSDDRVRLGATVESSDFADGWMSKVAIYDTPLPGDRVLAHAESALLRGYSEETAAARVGHLLDLANFWPVGVRELAGPRSVQARRQNKQALLDELQRTADVEQPGFFFFSRRNHPVLRPSTYSARFAPVAVFGDDPGGDEIPYRDVETSYSEENVRNAIVVEREGRNRVTRVEDATSIDEHGEITLPIGPLLSTNGSDDLAIANARLAALKDEKEELRRLEIDADYDPRIFALLVGLEAGDPIRVMRTPPGPGPRKAFDVRIQGGEVELRGTKLSGSFDVAPAEF